VEFDLEYLEEIIKARSVRRCFLVDYPALAGRFWPRLVLRALLDHKYGGYCCFRLYQRSVWLELRLERSTGILGITKEIRLLFRRQMSKLLFRVLAIVFLGRVSPYTEIFPGTDITFDNIRIAEGSRLHPGVFLAGNLALMANRGLSPTIQENANLLTGSVVVGGVTVGASATVTAYSVVMADVPDGTTVMGNPARAVFRRPV